MSARGTRGGGAASAAVVALIAGRLLYRQVRRLAPLGERQAAAQQLLLPVLPETVGPLSLATRYLAADQDSGLGGDLYAVQHTPYGIRLLIGDVRGKGARAAGTVVHLLAAFHREAERRPRLEEVVAALEEVVEEYRPRLAEAEDREEEFGTVLAAEISPDGSRLRLVNRGHPAPLLVGPREVRALEPGEAQLPLGMGGLAGSGAEVPRAEEAELPEGATLLLLTDGVTEARDPAGGECFDPVAWLRRNRFTAVGPLLDALCRDLGRHVGGRPADDVALLAVRRPAGARLRLKGAQARAQQRSSD